MTTTQHIAVECDVLPVALKQDAGLYISTALLTLIVLLFLSAKLSKQVTVPVETLCREVEEGKCSEDGPIQELNVLASAFNDAQKKLEGQLEREREFTRSAAHELKTPLAILPCTTTNGRCGARARSRTCMTLQIPEKHTISKP